jgi:hypothetical protein
MKILSIIIIFIFLIPGVHAQEESPLYSSGCEVFQEGTITWSATEVLCIRSQKKLSPSGIDPSLYEIYVTDKQYKSVVIYEHEFFFYENAKGVLVLTNSEDQSMLVEVEDPYEHKLKKRLKSKVSLLEEDLERCNFRDANKTLRIAELEKTVSGEKAETARLDRIVKGQLTITDCQEVPNDVYQNTTIELGKTSYQEGTWETIENLALLIVGIFLTCVWGWATANGERVR